MADQCDLETSGLLDGLEGAARVERVELISWLLDQGITVEQIRNAFMPMLLAARRVLGDDDTFVSARATAQKTGLDMDLLQRIQRAMGLPTVDDPDAAVYLRADAEAASFAQRFIEMGIAPDQIVQITRLLADGLSRVAEAMRYAGLASVLDPSASELVIAKNAEALMRAADPLLGPMIQEMLRLQLRHLMETEAISASERADGQRLPGARLVTTAFADLVGFTRLGEAVPPEDLERLARRLFELAHEVSAPPVRFVKTIGDEVMLVSADPVPLLEALMALVEQTEGDEDLPRLKVGMATGMAVSRAGDWFGGSVNLASRITGVARPGAILASETTREAIGDDERFNWSFAGARHLKGIKSDVKLFRVRRSDR